MPRGWQAVEDLLVVGVLLFVFLIACTDMPQQLGWFS